MDEVGLLNDLNSCSRTVRNEERCASSCAISAYIPAALLMLAGLVGLAAAWIMSGSGSGRYLVIAPWGASQAEAINLVRAADGGLVGMGRLSNIIIAGSNRPDFAAALRRAGAWGVIATPSRIECGEPLPGGQAS